MHTNLCIEYSRQNHLFNAHVKKNLLTPTKTVVLPVFAPISRHFADVQRAPLASIPQPTVPRPAAQFYCRVFNGKLTFHPLGKPARIAAPGAKPSPRAHEAEPLQHVQQPDPGSSPRITRYKPICSASSFTLPPPRPDPYTPPESPNISVYGEITTPCASCPALTCAACPFWVNCNPDPRTRGKTSMRTKCPN